MRIKRLELVGFKSCMDKTVLEFPAGITGIVGPNGCGKSNIVDAIRWVLGEQSVRQLRGQAMGDVIFAGNDTKGPLGMAEVTVAFDNEDPVAVATDREVGEVDGLAPSLQSLLHTAPEIQLTRRLYRSGESEYRINGNICRLRDITELFLGTGIGPKAYSIIEQGRVGHIVGAKPEELRLLIEEAAGTTLYRSRKLAAERKIDRTRDNLLRVSDIIRELERQANSLKRQARGAVRFQELTAEELATDKAVSAYRVQVLQSRIEDIGSELDAARQREAEAKAGVLDKQARCDELRLSLGEQNDIVERARQAHYEAKAKLARLEQEREFLHNRSSELERLLSEGRSEAQSLESKSAERAEAENQCTQEAVALSAELERLAGDRRQSHSRLENFEETIQAGLGRAEALRSEIVGKLAAEAATANERQALGAQITSMERRIAKLVEERHVLEDEGVGLRRDLDDCRRLATEVADKIRTAEQGKDAAAARLRGALQSKAKAEGDFAEVREELSTLRSKRESLRELEESFVGYGEGVRSFMKNGGREITGARSVLADVIEIEAGYERAVAAVLQDRLQHVVVPDCDRGIAGVAYMREKGIGRAAFVPVRPRARTVSAGSDSGHELLHGHVQAEEGYETLVTTLLEDVVVVEDLQEATGRWRTNGAGLTFVTRAGEVMEACGTVSGGSGKPVEEGILTRKAELTRLDSDLRVADIRVREQALVLERVSGAAKRSSEDLSGLDRHLHELTLRRVATEGEAELKRQALMRTQERLQAVDAEVSSLSGELASCRSRLAQLERTIAETGHRRSSLEADLKTVDQENSEIQARRREAVQELEDLKVREAEVRQKRESCEHRLAAVRGDRAELLSRSAVLERKFDRDETEYAEVGARLQAPETDIRAMQSVVAECASTLEDASERSRAARCELEAVDVDLRGTTEALEHFREARGEREIALKENQIERDSLLENTRGRTGLDADSLLAEACGEAFDLETTQARLERLRERIRRLGTVNVAAVTELEELQARLGEMTEQRDDLEKSIEDLRGTIARLNKVSRQRFKETFDEVDRIFRQTFPRLFPGGTARLGLSDESNLLDTGVEIFVQPPGKKPGNLNLLSGGEKALTAVSLIFSLFLYKPSPFCILDEVDAPLDEANVSRFTQMVSDMSPRSQFVVITHNKRTMDRCDTLYGVTMSQPGVSRIVSVDLGSRKSAA